MTRQRLFPIVLVICLAMAAVMPARAAEDVLDLIPGDAMGFLVVNRLAETDAKIQQTAQQMGLPPISPLTMFKTRDGIKGGVDEKRSAALVAMPAEDPGSKPAVLFVLPVSDFQKLIEPFEPDDPSAAIVQVQGREGPALVAELKGYALATEPKHRHVLEKALSSQKRGADLAFPRPWLAEQEIVGVLTTNGVQQACDKVLEGLEAARARMEALGGEDSPAAAGLKVYEHLFAMAKKQVTATAIGGQIDEQGVARVTSRTRFVAGEEVAESTAAEPAPRGLLTGMPCGPFVVAFGGVLPEESSEAMMRFWFDLIKSAPDLYGLSDEQADQMMELARESMKEVRTMSMMLGVSEPDEPLYSRMLFSMSTDDAQAYMGTYEEQIRAMNELFKDSKSPIFSAMDVTKIDMDGTPGLKVEMRLPTLRGMADIPQFARAMENLFGPGGTVKVFIAPVDEHTVVGAYTNEKTLRLCLEAAKRPQTALAADEAIAKTAALLPPGASVVGYWSLQGTIDFVNRGIAMFAPEGESPFELPEFPETPAVGFAATTSPNEVQTHLVIPSEVLKAIGAYATAVQKSVGEEPANSTVLAAEEKKPAAEPTLEDDLAEVGGPLWLIDADGSNLRRLTRMTDYTNCGTPRWCADGTKIACDAWKGHKGEGFRDAHVLVMSADGSSVKDLGDGAMPSWSPSGNRIAFCRYGSGVWIMDADGSGKKQFDRSGWCARWSPDGRKMACVAYDEGCNLRVHDLIEGDRRLVLEGEHRRYFRINHSFAWSPDGKQFCFKGYPAIGKEEIVIVDAEGSSKGFKVRLVQKTGWNLSWRPDGRRIMLGLRNPETKSMQLYTMDPDTEDRPELFPGQPATRNNAASAWSPDGKTIVFPSERRK